MVGRCGLKSDSLFHNGGSNMSTSSSNGRNYVFAILLPDWNYRICLMKYAPPLPNYAMNTFTHVTMHLWQSRLSITANAVEGLVKLLRRMTSGGRTEVWLIAPCTAAHQKCHTMRSTLTRSTYHEINCYFQHKN